MSHKVYFTEKDGSQGIRSFPTLSIANAYARTVKNGMVMPGTDDTTTVNITKCGSKEDEDAKRAAVRATDLTEKKAAAASEATRKTLAAGGTMQDASKAAREAERLVEASARGPRNFCACGKPCGKNNACYNCRRYP